MCEGWVTISKESLCILISEANRWILFLCKKFTVLQIIQKFIKTNGAVNGMYPLARAVQGEPRFCSITTKLWLRAHGLIMKDAMLS